MFSVPAPPWPSSGQHWTDFSLPPASAAPSLVPLRSESKTSRWFTTSQIRSVHKSKCDKFTSRVFFFFFTLTQIKHSDEKIRNYNNNKILCYPHCPQGAYMRTVKILSQFSSLCDLKHLNCCTWHNDVKTVNRHTGWIKNLKFIDSHKTEEQTWASASSYGSTNTVVLMTLISDCKTEWTLRKVKCRIIIIKLYEILEDSNDS